MSRTIIKLSFLLATFGLNAGCAHEVCYRGVPEVAWQQLNSEQKQLIIDQSFAKAMAENP